MMRCHDQADALFRYYEKQGFVPVGDFVPTEKEWPGCVMEMLL